MSTIIRNRSHNFNWRWTLFIRCTQWQSCRFPFSLPTFSVRTVPVLYTDFDTRFFTTRLNIIISHWLRHQSIKITFDVICFISIVQRQFCTSLAYNHRAFTVMAHADQRTSLPRRAVATEDREISLWPPFLTCSRATEAWRYMSQNENLSEY